MTAGNDRTESVLATRTAARPQFAAPDNHRRAEFVRAVAVSLDAVGEELVRTANRETSLGQPRLRNDLTRTTGQLNRFVNLVDEGSLGRALEGRRELAEDPSRLALPGPPLTRPAAG